MWFEELVERVRQMPGVGFGYLFGSQASGFGSQASGFGSRASGAPRDDSDWDLAIYLDPGLSPMERVAIARTILSSVPIGSDLDLVVLNDAPPLLAHRALQGRQLFVNDRVGFVRFFVRAVGASMDEEHWRQLHRTARMKRVKEGRFGRS